MNRTIKRTYFLLPVPDLPGKKKVAFSDWTFSGRLSCYSVISSLQIFDDISYIIKRGRDLTVIFHPSRSTASLCSIENITSAVYLQLPDMLYSFYGSPTGRQSPQGRLRYRQNRKRAHREAFTPLSTIFVVLVCRINLQRQRQLL